MAQWEGIAQESAGTASDWLFAGLWSWPEMLAFIIKLLVAIIVVGLLVFLCRLFSKFIERRIRLHSIVDDDDYTKKVSGLVGDIVFYTLTIFAIFIWFSIVGVDFSFMLWWISFGLWFAFKDILGNLLAGLMVLTNNDYKLWDIIVIDDDKKEYFWRIEELTIRYTVIRTFDLRKVIIPNLKMVTKPIRTYDAEELIRLETKVTIHYNTSVEFAIETITAAVNAVSFVKEKKNTRVMLQNMWDHGLEMLIFFYVDPSGGMLIPVVLSEVNEAIFASFTQANIVIPYPHTAITVDHNDKNLLWSALYVMKEWKK